jgi:hypothetical protein
MYAPAWTPSLLVLRYENGLLTFGVKYSTIWSEGSLPIEMTFRGGKAKSSVASESSSLGSCSTDAQSIHTSLTHSSPRKMCASSETVVSYSSTPVSGSGIDAPHVRKRWAMGPQDNLAPSRHGQVVPRREEELHQHRCSR